MGKSDMAEFAGSIFYNHYISGIFFYFICIKDIGINYFSAINIQGDSYCKLIMNIIFCQNDFPYMTWSVDAIRLKNGFYVIRYSHVFSRSQCYIKLCLGTDFISQFSIYHKNGGGDGVSVELLYCWILYTAIMSQRVAKKWWDINAATEFWIKLLATRLWKIWAWWRKKI